MSISGEAVLSACQHACSIIDMNAHDGIHPCMGAVDLVPLYPLGEEVGLEDCGQEAHGTWSSRNCSLKTNMCENHRNRWVCIFHTKKNAVGQTTV